MIPRLRLHEDALDFFQAFLDSGTEADEFLRQYNIGIDLHRSLGWALQQRLDPPTVWSMFFGR